MDHLIISFALLSLSMSGVGSIHSPFLHQKSQADGIAAKAEVKSYFEEDSRLDQKITIKSYGIAHRELWQVLENKIRAPIEREEAASEIEADEIVIAASNVPVPTLMDAVAARVLARWERTQHNGYRMLVNQFELDFVFGAKSEREQERFAAGAAFIQDMNALPAQKRALLQSGEYVAFSSLPASMQQSLTQMLFSLSLEYQAKGKPATLQPEVLPQAAFRLERKPAQGFNRYFITVKADGGRASGWRFNDYEAQKQAREAARQEKQKAGEPNSIYTPVKWELSHREAKRLPALKRPITLDMKAVTFPEVLRRLHEKYNIAFISDSRKSMPDRADIVLRSLTLGDALDRLTQIYRNTEWEWRKDGFLIVRSSSNPTRHINDAPYAKANK